MNNVVLFMPSLAGGGAERVMLSLANGFAERKIPVVLIVVTAKGVLAKEVSDGVQLIDLQCGRTAQAIWPLVQYLRKLQPSMVLATQGHANVIAYLAHRLAGKPGRLVLREASTPSYNLKELSRSPFFFVLKYLMKIAYTSADVLVCPANAVAEDARRYFAHPLPNIKIIYNPVINEELFQLSAVPIMHPWFNDGEPPVVLAVGRLNIAKDYPTLLKAFSFVRKQRKIRLIILGEGEERFSLEKLIQELNIKDDVAMLGFDSNPFKYMKRSDVFVLSSRWEGLPNVLIQALALGCPVISTDCPSGPAEILNNGEYGELVEVGNVEMLAEHINAFFDKHIKRKLDINMKRYEHEYVISKYIEEIK